MNATTKRPHAEPEPKPKAAEKLPFLTTCAALCRALRESGTGQDKLNVLRGVLTANPNATAEEGYNALWKNDQVTQRTLDKARGLIDQGVVPPTDPQTHVVPVEDVILGNLGTDVQRAEGGKHAAERIAVLSAERIAFANQGLNEQQLAAERSKWESQYRAAMEEEIRAKVQAEFAEKAKQEVVEVAKKAEENKDNTQTAAPFGDPKAAEKAEARADQRKEEASKPNHDAPKPQEKPPQGKK